VFASREALDAQLDTLCRQAAAYRGDALRTALFEDEPVVALVESTPELA
jgi:hypothetical protein